MKLLVLGSGGREHALVWKLAQSPHVTRIWSAPGNAGIAQERVEKTGAVVEIVPLSAEDLPRVLELAREIRPDLTVVGPDNPLALGIVDLFRENGFRIWGPNKRAAQFESSKVFAQRFMEEYDIPTARAGSFAEAAPARAFAESLGGKCAVKADGLALGKGVVVCGNMSEASRAIDDILVGKAFGDAGSRIVIQEYLEGTEVSLHALCDGRTAKLFPTAQDHKRALDGDRGPNTGGMGAYSPTPFVSELDLVQVKGTIIGRWLAGCAMEGIDFKGICYPGIMLTAQGPKVLEFNARFGDPETQVYMARLESDLFELLDASISGTLGRSELRWRPVSAVCVVLASKGYPGAHVKGVPIQGLDAVAAIPQTKVFHAGTALGNGRVVTNGGRVLGVTAWADTLAEAQANAYRAVSKIQFDGMHFRRDIAARALGGDPSRI